MSLPDSPTVSPGIRTRVEVMHGVNLDQLGRRDPQHYGGIGLTELEVEISAVAHELGLTVSFFHTNHEGDFVEHLHRLDGLADGIILNPGAWSHYSYAIRDALEIAALPAVEVHLSNIEGREPWRAETVFGELCLERISGQGAAGYRSALERLAREFAA
ncbi:MAG TPA: type II 3-dehydroquinate dehydratase [Solirubrobacteraceae bacterium]|nr:type II 3-dehydroquinate dehydratase [Solirubrobacteraceae bacterium]